MSDSRDSFANLDAAARKESDQPVGSPVQPCPYARKVRLRIALRDASFGVQANRRYQLQVGAEIFKGVTTPEGLIDQLLPSDATEARLQVWPVEAEGARPRVWKLELGKLLPASMLEGAQARLVNLGFASERSGTAGPKTKAALGSFQALFQLEETETLDSATQKRLDEVYRQPEAVAETGVHWTPPVSKPFKPSQTRAANPPVARVRDE
ncbi:peptidoglycan-binding domain-containing protein [Pyxidicoccus xibeiensis]|uniref:peptidoglycan-binding domain-containing protein n=1 Tax=Pyxidicoccus xibeiensis TaxID=2906759 RepID=UPI0020A749A1|nr:peptidoglycan-binding protein [Pyxidicoccus xibeiensis]MCP3135803.1 peptidoglycan-binding protein [Pyxidicoccus xibeiensis]